VVLFFEKGAPTENIWYYQLNLDRNLGKTYPLNEEDLAEFVELQKTKADSNNSWKLNIQDMDKTNYDLSAKNPNSNHINHFRDPLEIIKDLKNLDSKTSELLNKIENLL